jgi:alkanesulfonate monooxygenase SsuD/methylene tetrahydromethanopterin reductase-like flavin-dependent oxidoreductase (luciferase family)
VGVSWLTSLVLAPTREQAEAERNALLARRGMDWNTLPDHVKENLSRAILLGDPDSVCEFLQTLVLDVGVDGVIVNLPANGHDLDAVALAGETLGKLLA